MYLDGDMGVREGVCLRWERLADASIPCERVRIGEGGP